MPNYRTSSRTRERTFVRFVKRSRSEELPLRLLLLLLLPLWKIPATSHLEVVTVSKRVGPVR
jgi:hypothetical protein